MCGILGYVSWNKTVSHDQFRKALRKLDPRGPDHSNVVQIANVTLGHTRLSILDQSSVSHQPMCYQGKYYLIFNGEIYNYKELKKELLQKGYTFETTSDTEVLLAAYVCWGEGCVERFNGMWAFAIYDKKRETLFCSRDRFGIKPFYYIWNEEYFLWGSEIKALLDFSEKRRVNYNVLTPFITRGVTDYGEETFFASIKKLLPSQNLTLSTLDQTLKIETYYQLKASTQTLGHEALYSLLEESVSLRLRSDVKVGTCLSGGLDSSVLTAIAKKLSHDNLTSIHAKSTMKQNDESMYALRVADVTGVNLEIIEPSSEAFWQNIDDVVYRQEEPFVSTSIFMQYFVMKKAKDAGCIVMLDGQGADELFLGYEHYLTHIYSELKKNQGFDEESFFSELKLFRMKKERIIEAWENMNDFEASWVRIQKGGIKKGYLHKELFKDLFGVLPDPLSFQTREIYSKNLQALLRYEDRNSMSFGVEARLPYLDYRLVEAVMGLPVEKKCAKGYLKYPLRKAIESNNLLPNDIIWRYNKMGFEAPQNEWIKRYKDKMLQEIFDSKLIEEVFESVDIREESFLWRLFNIARWEKVFNVSL